MQFCHGYLEGGETGSGKGTWEIQCIANILFLKLDGR